MDKLVAVGVIVVVLVSLGLGASAVSKLNDGRVLAAVVAIQSGSK